MFEDCSPFPKYISLQSPSGHRERLSFGFDELENSAVQILAASQIRVQSLFGVCANLARTPGRMAEAIQINHSCNRHFLYFGVVLRDNQSVRRDYPTPGMANGRRGRELGRRGEMEGVRSAGQLLWSGPVENQAAAAGGAAVGARDLPVVSDLSGP